MSENNSDRMTHRVRYSCKGTAYLEFSFFSTFENSVDCEHLLRSDMNSVNFINTHPPLVIINNLDISNIF